jgi:hypothetical protein
MKLTTFIAITLSAAVVLGGLHWKKSAQQEEIKRQVAAQLYIIKTHYHEADQLMDNNAIGIHQGADALTVKADAMTTAIASLKSIKDQQEPIVIASKAYSEAAKNHLNSLANLMRILDKHDKAERFIAIADTLSKTLNHPASAETIEIKKNLNETKNNALKLKNEIQLIKTTLTRHADELAPLFGKDAVVYPKDTRHLNRL